MTSRQREWLRGHRYTHDKANSWWLRDAYGLECCRVCDRCEHLARQEFRPEIFEGPYETDEPIEPE